MIDTIAFEPNPSGIAANVPSSPGKHTVERLTLTADRTRLRYETTVEDPAYLTEPATLTMQWDHNRGPDGARANRPRTATLGMKFVF